MGASYAESAPATAIWCIDSFALVVTGEFSFFLSLCLQSFCEPLYWARARETHLTIIVYTVLRSMSKLRRLVQSILTGEYLDCETVETCRAAGVDRKAQAGLVPSSVRYSHHIYEHHLTVLSSNCETLGDKLS